MSDMAYEVLERILMERGMTPYQVSKALNWYPSTLSDWKRGKSKPKADKLFALAAYLDVPVETFMAPRETISRPITDYELMFALFGTTKEITKKDLEDVKRFAKFILAEKEEKHDKG